MKAGRNSQDQVMTQGLVLKGKLGDVPELEVIYKKEEVSLKDSLWLDPLKKPNQPLCWIKSSTTIEKKN